MVIPIKKQIYSIFILFLIIVFLGSHSMTSEAKDYRYSIDGGSPNRYPAIYDFEGNYFTNDKGGRLLAFVPGGNTLYWGGGAQATLASEKNPMPYGIKVRWYSVTENIFWEGSYVFDQQMLKGLTQYKINDILFRKTKNFIDSMSFTVYVTPGGLVTVWITGGGEKFLLAQFYAQKMQQEPDWNAFYRRSIDKIGEPRPKDIFIKYYLQLAQDYIESALNGKAEFFDDSQPASKPLTASPWLRLMKKYDWYLSINDQYFTLRDYRASFTNGELRFVYSGDSQLSKPKSVPDSIYFFIQNKQNNNIPERIFINFDQDEIMKVFAELALTPPMSEPINLYMNIKPDLSDLQAYVIKGNKKILLKKASPELVDLYDGGYDINTPWPEQTRHWK